MGDVKTNIRNISHPLGDADSRAQHEKRISWLEETDAPILPLASDYTPAHVVPPHRHSRAQLLYALTGTIEVMTEDGRWMVPPDHALWVPAGIEHSVISHGYVRMRSIYVTPGTVCGLPESSRVVGVTDLMRSLLVEAVKLPIHTEPDSRGGLIMALIEKEIPSLPEKPLGLPMPTEPRLATLCQEFLRAPSPHSTIDQWADTMAMSRRAFTRAFRRETGLSLSAWRQQASLFAALPRLAAGEPVTSVALDLGYESVPAFTTMFRRILGAPPSRYSW